MNSIVESRIETLQEQKKSLVDSIKAFEKTIIDLKKKINEVEEEIQILKSQ
jgi:prefoldin subunit 5